MAKAVICALIASLFACCRSAPVVSSIAFRAMYQEFTYFSNLAINLTFSFIKATRLMLGASAIGRIRRMS